MLLLTREDEKFAEGVQTANERVATDMLKESYPLSAIEKISRLSEDVIRKLAASLGIAVS